VIQQRISLLHVTGLVRLGDSMWIGIMLICFDPMALSCKIIAKPEPFYTEQACLEEAEQIAANIRAGGAYATPHCHKVEGSSA
jgi:hypothetical protein